jgi:hypothetical protein
MSALLYTENIDQLIDLNQDPLRQVYWKSGVAT